MTLFEFVDVINKKKPLKDMDGYSPWMINRMFSCSPVFYPLASEMTKYPDITAKMHFDCYFYGIPKNSNFIQYSAKKQKLDEDIDMVAEFYEVSRPVAKDYIELMSKEELKKIDEFYNKRGRVK